MRKRVCQNFTRERKEEIDELGFDQCKILNSKLIPPLKQVEEDQNTHKSTKSKILHKNIYILSFLRVVASVYGSRPRVQI